MAMAPDTSPQQPCCFLCQLNAEETGSAILRCGNCGTFYCSKGCQALHWPVHKLSCGILVGNDGRPIQRMPARFPPGNSHLSSINFPNVHTKEILKAQTDESITYRLIIDAHRLWDEENRIQNGQLDLDPKQPKTQYIEGYSLKRFRMFLDALEAVKPSCLPAWWSDEKHAACIETAENMFHWSDITTTVPREIDDWNRYGGGTVRLVLRVFGAMISRPRMINITPRGRRTSLTEDEAQRLDTSPRSSPPNRPDGAQLPHTNQTTQFPQDTQSFQASQVPQGGQQTDGAERHEQSQRTAGVQRPDVPYDPRDPQGFDCYYEHIEYA